jgi:hypothetical protein
MEKINSEILISTLFLIGFDRVDSLLFKYVLGKLSIDNIEKKDFIFEDEELSGTFNQYVDFNGSFYSLKNNYSLDTNVPLVSGSSKILPLRKVININEKLLMYFNSIDFTTIISRKVNDIGYNNLKDFDYLFSEKEKQIIFNKSEDIAHLKCKKLLNRINK